MKKRHLPYPAVPLSWAACSPHCEQPSSCSFTKGLNGSHCSIFISRMVVVGVTGRREMDWLWHPQTFPPSSLTQHHHGWVARVDVRSLLTRVLAGWDNATLYEIDSGGKGVYCQLARGGGSGGWGFGLALVSQPQMAGTSASLGGYYKNRPAEKHPRGAWAHQWGCGGVNCRERGPERNILGRLNWITSYLKKEGAYMYWKWSWNYNFKTNPTNIYWVPTIFYVCMVITLEIPQ